MSLVGAIVTPHPPMIIPAVGKGKEACAQKTIDAMKQAAYFVAQLAPETIIYITPHATVYNDYFHISPREVAHGNMHEFGDKSVNIDFTYDVNFIEALENEAQSQDIDAGTEGQKNPDIDHGMMVPAYYINQEYSDYQAIRMSISGLPLIQHYQLGTCIRKIAKQLDRRVLIVASGDLSHRLDPTGPNGFSPAAAIFDEQVVSALESANFGALFEFDNEIRNRAGECGLRSFVLMAGAFDGLSVDSHILSYEGPCGVGYAVATFTPKDSDASRRFGAAYIRKLEEKLHESRKNEDEYIHLARLALETYIKGRTTVTLETAKPSQELQERKAGCFVSLKIAGDLRGCIGTIDARDETLAEEIIHNAIEAGIHDPRFSAVKASELNQIVYSVDVLSEPEKIESLEDHDPKTYGLIVTKHKVFGDAVGLLLPNLEGIDTAQQQYETCCEKAGLDPARIASYTLERFTVERHE